MLKKIFLTFILCFLTLPVLAGGSGDIPDNLTCTHLVDSWCILNDVGYSSPTCAAIGGQQNTDGNGECKFQCTMGEISCPDKNSGTWHDVDGKEGMEQNDECHGTYNIAGTNFTCTLPDQNQSPIYRCKAGYWGDPNVDSGNCTECPSWNGVSGIYSYPEDLVNNKTFGVNTTKDKCCVPGVNAVHYEAGHGYVTMNSDTCCIQITQ